MSVLVIDIETIPQAASLAAEYPSGERNPPSNYSKPETVAAWRERDRASWAEQRVKEASLSPRLGRVCCVGWAIDGEPVLTSVAKTEAEEPALLRGVWGLLADRPRIVGFNSSFDLRFIVVRSMVHRIVPPASVGDVSSWFARYRTHPHCDTRALLTGWDNSVSGRLHEWAAAFGITTEDATSGADTYGYAQDGNWSAIERHCASDVALTRALYHRIAPVFLPRAA